jgi:PAS domain S-box-containing protein
MGSRAEHAIVAADATGRITYWSSGAEELFGYRAEQAIGQTLDLIVPEPLRERHWAGFRRAMLAPRVRDLAADIPVRCADGQVRTLAGRLLVLSDALNQAIGAIGIFAAEGTTGRHPFG